MTVAEKPKIDWHTLVAINASITTWPFTTPRRHALLGFKCGYKGPSSNNFCLSDFEDEEK